MCQAISLILTEKKVIRIPGVERHNDIMTLSDIEDDSCPPDFVKVELLPPDSDDPEAWLDWRRWRVGWDQDRFPDWFIDSVDKGRVYDWAERHARVVKDAKIVTGHIDLLVGECGEVVGLCTIARCAPGSSLDDGGRAIVRHGDSLSVRNGDNMRVVYGDDMSVSGGGRMSVWRGGCMNVKRGSCMSVERGERMSVEHGDRMSVDYGDGMNVELGERMGVKYGDWMSVEHGGRMSVEHGGRMSVKHGERMSVERGERMSVEDGGGMSVEHGGEMIVHRGGKMTVENPEYARILDRETD